MASLTGAPRLDARPHVGIGPFRLGMSREAVRAVAGEPESVDFFNEDDICAEHWYFGDGRIEVSFDDDDPLRVSDISALAPGVTLNGVEIIGRAVADLRFLAEQAGLDDLRPDDDFDEMGACFTSAAHSVMFWVLDDEVVNFTLFPRYDESGNEPQWPA